MQTRVEFVYVETGLLGLHQCCDSALCSLIKQLMDPLFIQLHSANNQRCNHNLPEPEETSSDCFFSLTVANANGSVYNDIKPAHM